MPIIKENSVSLEDETYLQALSTEPKMTMDEVGADIDEHGHVPVTEKTSTKDPFTAKGAMSYALDELEDAGKESEGIEPTIQQDKAVIVKDSQAEALDAITMDGAEEIEAKPTIGKEQVPDYTNYSEENGSHISYKAPDIPASMGGDEDKPDENGLVYVTATFTVDPEKYISNNYRPASAGKAPDAGAVLRKASAAMNRPAANPEEEASLSDLGNPEAKEEANALDEPTEKQENGQDGSQEEKNAADSAPESVVLDYATFIDGSSFICFDEVSDIDYSKIAMDAGPKKIPTKKDCQTTFAQCRAKNPLFCRFHGPKLLEADIKGAIKATVGSGCTVQVTKDKNSKNKFTFRLTVGCPPSKKKMVEKMVHMYLTQNPGISSSTEDWNLVGKHKQTQEFEMDILQADKPPKKDTKADQMLSNTKKAIKEKKQQDVVGETSPALEKKVAKGEKWDTVDEEVENEWANLVDNTVHKSLLGNNKEFLSNFNKIADQFDSAHDAGDADGLKKALESLKGEIGKYDSSTGEKEGDGEPSHGEEEDVAEPPSGETQEKDSLEKNAKNDDVGEVVLPSPAKKEETASTAPEEKKSSNPIVEKAKISLGALTDAMKQDGLEEDDHLSAFAYGASYYIEKAEASAKTMEDLDNALLASKEDDSASPTNKEMKIALIEKAKAEEEKFFYENIGLAEQQTAFLNEALDKALMVKGDDQKRGLADKVEETVKRLAKSIFGGDRPPQGADSVPDYLDYMVDEVNSIGKTTPVYASYVGSDKDKAVQDAYAKAASLSTGFDAKIMSFKGAMDDGNMEEAEQLEDEIKKMGGELSNAFSGLKKACDSAKDYLNAEAELQKKKDALLKKIQDLSQKVGDPYSSLQHDIKPLISNALSRNGGFTNFNTYDSTSVDGTTHYIKMEKKQKKGFNEDEDDAAAPTTEELAMLEKNLNEEFNKYGLSVKPSTHMNNYGKDVYFEVGKKESIESSKKQADPPEQEKSKMSDEEKKAKIAAMSPKQKMSVAIQYLKKQIASNHPNKKELEEKLKKAETLFAKL